jgi:hypothetical protein
MMHLVDHSQYVCVHHAGTRFRVRRLRGFRHHSRSRDLVPSRRCFRRKRSFTFDLCKRSSLRTDIYRDSNPANGHTGIGHGQYNNSYVDWTNGAIDDVRFYASALSAANVPAIARLGIPTLPGPEPVQPASLSIDAGHPGAPVNPLFTV